MIVFHSSEFPRDNSLTITLVTFVGGTAVVLVGSITVVAALIAWKVKASRKEQFRGGLILAKVDNLFCKYS